MEHAQHCESSVAVNVSFIKPFEQLHPAVPVHRPDVVVQGPALTGSGASVTLFVGDGGAGADAPPPATPSHPLEPPPVPQH